METCFSKALKENYRQGSLCQLENCSLSLKGTKFLSFTPHKREKHVNELDTELAQTGVGNTFLLTCDSEKLTACVSQSFSVKHWQYLNIVCKLSLGLKVIIKTDILNSNLITFNQYAQTSLHYVFAICVVNHVSVEYLILKILSASHWLINLVLKQLL